MAMTYIDMQVAHERVSEWVQELELQAECNGLGVGDYAELSMHRQTLKELEAAMDAEERKAGVK